MLLLVFGVLMAANASKTVFLKPSSNWQEAGARFALYMFGTSEAWADFVPVEGAEGIYQATFDDAQTGMIICRMNPAASQNSWDNKWNQSGDLSAPTADNLLYTIAEGQWDGFTVDNGLTVTPYDVPKPVVIESMYIVGDLTGGWPTDEGDWSMAKAMTKSSTNANVWTLTLTDVELEAKTYEYKATANQKWGDYELPAEGNMEYAIEEAGKYTLSFMIDVEKNILKLVAEKQIPEPVKIESMYIVGDLTGGWPNDETNDWSMAKAMTKSADNEHVWTLTLTDVQLEAQTYEYKAAANQKWGDYELPMDGNNQYVINEAGTYTLTFTANTEEHTLTLDAVKQSIIPEITKVELRGDWNWESAEGMTKVGENNTWTMTLDLSATDADQQFKLVINDNLWIGNGSNTVISAPEGWVEGLEDGDWNWVLKNSTTGYQTYTVTALWLPNENAAVNWALKFEGKDERVEGILAPKTADGQPAVVYNLQGVRISQPSKHGLYIVNGRKVKL